MSGAPWTWVVDVACNPCTCLATLTVSLPLTSIHEPFRWPNSRAVSPMRTWTFGKGPSTTLLEMTLSTSSSPIRHTSWPLPARTVSVWSTDGLVEAVVRGAPARLNDGGMLQVLANWAHIGDQPWSERLATWVEGTGCDLWAVEREHLDVCEYIETWLTDAGLDGSPQWRPRYDEWLSYFDTLDVTGVSLGWITLTKAGRDEPDLSFEEWPWQVAQPIGGTMAQRAQAVTWARLSDEDLVARRWRIASDVDNETTGRPGATDPEHIVLRQRRGLCRAVEMTTASGGVLGACDGELTLGQITGAVSAILEVDHEDVLAEVLPLVRECLRHGILEAA